jgi:phosphoserine aminotransferase
VTLPELTIPRDMLPADGRFGCGPSKIRPQAVERLAAVSAELLGTSHRKPDVKGQVRRLQEGLAALFALPDGYEVLVTLGGATAFWDAAAFGLVRARALHLVYGEFSSKFADSTRGAPFLADPVVVKADPGSARSRTSPKAAASQNAVDPPLPSTTS